MNKKTILIVEDNLSIVKMLADKLRTEGFNVLQANDGQEGLMVAYDNNPDIILLDIIMPKMDGLTMMKEIRSKNEWGKKVPIILITNLSPDDDRINKIVTEYIPSYYILKSNWNLNDVLEKVKEMLNIV
jgi:DNA-binding response OmpR family regulator